MPSSYMSFLVFFIIQFIVMAGSTLEPGIYQVGNISLLVSFNSLTDSVTCKALEKNLKNKLNDGNVRFTTVPLKV